MVSQGAGGRGWPPRCAALVVEQLLARGGGITEGERFDALVEQVESRATDPYSAVDALLAGRE